MPHSTVVDQWPLSGRQHERSRLVEHLFAGDGPRAVVLAGAPGVGKTRLAREVADAAADRGFDVVSLVASEATGAVPFGALAPLLPELATDATPLTILAQATSALTSRDRPPFLLVDDAHLLDAGSASFVQNVVTGDTAPTLVTVRGGTPTADVIHGLWKDDWAVRIDLGALSRLEVGELLAAALGGPVAAATQLHLWEASQGNVLHLRELVRRLLDSGVLTKQGGAWHIPAKVPVVPELVDLIAARLDELDKHSRTALEMLAVAGQLPVDRLLDHTPTEVVHRLEGEGLVALATSEHRSPFTLAHPLYGEALLARLPAARHRQICRALADGMSSNPSHPSDIIRLATWRLDAGDRVDPELLAHAARCAFVQNELTLAERLASAARERGAGFDAGLLMAETALLCGRHEEAEARFAVLAPEVATDRDRARLVSARSNNLASQLGREDDALAVLDEAFAAISDDKQARLLAARLAVAHTFGLRPVAALAAVERALHTPDGEADDSHTTRTAYYAGSVALAVLGRVDEAVAMGSVGYARHVSSGVRDLPVVHRIGSVMALVWGGQVDAAAAMASDAHEQAVRSTADGDRETRATFGLLLGFATAAQGRVDDARAALRDAAAVNRELGDITALRWTLGALALVEAAAGDADAAAGHVDELALYLIGTAPAIFEADLVERGQAWAAQMAGRRDEAMARLRSAADRVAHSGAAGVELFLRHDLVRLGEAGEVRNRLHELAAIVEGPLAPALAAHANAVEADDSDALAEVANQLERLGYGQLAMEAMAGAAEGFRRTGSPRLATATERRVVRLRERLGISAPAATLSALPELSRREREVANLAATGMSTREIAASLFISARTVETHLQAAYTKLGVSSRGELADALGPVDQP